MTARAHTPAWLAALLRAEGLPPAYAAAVDAVWSPLADELAAEARARPGLVVGVSGVQGSGKSTLCAVLERLLAERGLRAVTLALDDLYLTRTERARLAAEVHPLLVTRGPPGTHDTDLGLTLIERLRGPGRVLLPRFDKAADDRRAPSPADAFEGPADLILFEGWCVGARPQPEAALAAPVNALERHDDPDGRWRAWVNATLAGPYRALFAAVDRLVLLRAPSWEIVRTWRGEQEAKLRARLAARGGDLSRTLDAAALDRFLAHYERLTRWILADLPARADVVVDLDQERTPARRA